MTKQRISLANRLTFWCAVLAAVAILFATLMTVLSNIRELRISVTEDFSVIADSLAHVVESEYATYRYNVQEIGEVTDMYLKVMEHEEFHEFLHAKQEEFGFSAIYITDVNGVTESGIDFSQYEFTAAALAGNTHLGEAQIRADGSGADVMLSAPRWKDGVMGSEVTGVVIAVLDAQKISDALSRIYIGEGAGAYIINSEGYTIADTEYEYVLSHENTILLSESDDSVAKFATIEKAALSTREPQIGKCTLEGESLYLAVVPMQDYDWAVGVYAPEVNYTASMYASAFFSMGVALVLILILTLVMNKIAHKITTPLKVIAKTADRVAVGDYDVTLDYDCNDEIGDLTVSFGKLITNTQASVADASRVLGAMAVGDFTARPNAEYLGEFKKLGSAVNTIAVNMTDSFVALRDSANSVVAGALQVDSGAQALAQGSTEQAAAVQQLAATMGEVTHQVATTAENASEANTITKEANECVRVGNARMEELSTSMTNMEETSRRIHDIIKTIDDIAFQTNILALNAAIEAARAGTAGKGFAVVADEVRSLAAKSAEAANDTTVLIENAIAAIDSGAKATADTAAALHNITELINKASSKMEEINTAADVQAMSIQQLSSGVDQISAVVQNNSAIAEQSAAASAALSQEGEHLTNIISRFKV